MSADHLMRERLLVLLAALVVALVRLALYLLPSRMTLDLLRRLADSPPRATPGSRPSAARLVASVERASRRVPHATCLTQAVAAKLLLRRFGYPGRLCVGVARDAGGSYRAHAWLEDGGRILIGGAASRAYARLAAFDSSARRADGEQVTS